MSLAVEIQEILSELFDEDLYDTGISQTMTYHVALIPSSQIYDPESGRYVDTVSSADGAFWFDDEDNSHWLAAF